MKKNAQLHTQLGIGIGGVQFTTEQLAIGADEHWCGLLREFSKNADLPAGVEKRFF